MLEDVRRQDEVESPFQRTAVFHRQPVDRGRTSRVHTEMLARLPERSGILLCYIDPDDAASPVPNAPQHLGTGTAANDKYVLSCGVCDRSKESITKPLVFQDVRQPCFDRVAH